MRKIAISIIVLTILALLLFQPGVIGGSKPHRTPEVRLRSRPAFFQVDLGPVFTPHIPSTTTSTTTTSTTTTTTTVGVVDTVTPYERAEWDRVNVCEEGGNWGYSGYGYPDGLGISREAWYEYGGGSDLSPDAQIMVGERIESAAGEGGYVPDQGYCAAW